MIHTPISLIPVLMAAEDPAQSGAPEWVHLLPAARGAIQTSDNRGPYHVTDAAQLIALSFATADKLPIDENHATDLAAPKGLPAPARGWIVEMQARADGIWGRVEWTDEGRALVAGHAYRALSPVITHSKAKEVGRILRASLVNRPNLLGLAALNMETTMTLMERLAELLGLDAGATDDQIVAAINAMKTKKPDADAPALQSALSEIGVALGVQGDTAAIIAAAKSAKTATPAQITALQAELTDVATQLKAVKGEAARNKAEAFVDGEIKKGRTGVKPLRDHYVAMHMEDPGRVEKEIGSFQILGPSGTLITAPTMKDGEVSLNAAQREVSIALGISEKNYAATLKAERGHEEAL